MSLKSMEFYVIVPESSKNLVHNCVPYQNLNGYTNYNSSCLVDPTYTRRGPGCIKVVPASGIVSGVFYSNLSVTSGQPYTFSVDVKGVAGQAMRIFIADNAGTAKATKTFTATGNWQRVDVTLASCGDTATNYRVYVQRDAVASVSPFWIDGWQFENKPYATTFIYGYERGLGYIDREYWWDGQPFNSPSVRSAFTRHGGRLVRISDYCRIISTEGLGEGLFDQVMTEMAMGGSTYQTHITKRRPFSIVVQFSGDQATMQANRKALISYLRPDGMNDQPMVLRYQGFDENGNEATQPLDIVCAPEPSLTSIPQNPVEQKAILSFTALDATLNGAYYEGSYLLYSQSLTMNSIIMQRRDGSWSTMGTGLQTGFAWCIVEGPDGKIYVGGEFASAGGVAGTKNLARWNPVTETWESVVSTGPDSSVRALRFDAQGNLYVGGYFNSMDGVAVNHLAKVSNVITGPPVVTQFGEPNGNVLTIDIDPNGAVYAGGIFTQIGGASAYNAAYYDGAWHPLDTNGSVYKIKCGYQNNKVLIGGQFSTPFPFVTYWDGDSFHSFRNGLNNVVNDIILIGNLVVAGGNFTDFVSVCNGRFWSKLPFGSPNDQVKVLAGGGEKYYVGGAFTKVGNLNLQDRVAMVCGGHWERLPIDLPGTNFPMAIYYSGSDDLYISLNGNGTAVVSGVVIDNVVNGGSASDSYPVIQIKGPGSLQSIINHTSGKHVDFDGLIVQPGEYINLWLDPHNLKFESSWSGRGSVLDYIAAGSDIADFNLEPGTNNIAVFMPAGTTSDTNVWIRWQPKFWSIDGALL